MEHRAVAVVGAVLGCCDAERDVLQGLVAVVEPAVHVGEVQVQ